MTRPENVMQESLLGLDYDSQLSSFITYPGEKDYYFIVLAGSSKLVITLLTIVESKEPLDVSSCIQTNAYRNRGGKQKHAVDVIIVPDVVVCTIEVCVLSCWWESCWNVGEVHDG